jgi:hypothetical protein
MIFIAHRGNTNGPNPSRENSPSYIQEALEQGYFVEVDVWLQNRKIYLGHDEPQYEVGMSFLESNDRIVCHAKNAGALALLISKGLHCFGHDRDDVVLTSRGWLWTFPGKQLTCQSVAVMPESEKGWDITNCRAFCSDYATFQPVS